VTAASVVTTASQVVVLAPAPLRTWRTTTVATAITPMPTQSAGEEPQLDREPAARTGARDQFGQQHAVPASTAAPTRTT
jgi:hypothetical protein